MKELQALVDAWVVPGPMPQYHNAFKLHLQADWPVLATAIEDLIAALGDTVLHEIDRDAFYNLIGMEPTDQGAIQEEWLVQVWPESSE